MRDCASARHRRESPLVRSNMTGRPSSSGAASRRHPRRKRRPRQDNATIDSIFDGDDDEAKRDLRVGFAELKEAERLWIRTEASAGATPGRPHSLQYYLA